MDFVELKMLYSGYGSTFRYHFQFALSTIKFLGE